MVEFGPFWPNRRNRQFMLKPASIFNQDHPNEFLSRPLKLKTLVMRNIAKMFDAGSFDAGSFDEGINIFDTIPNSLKMDIFNIIKLKNESWHSRNVAKDNVFKAWLTLFTGPELVLEEFLGEHWSKLVFSHVVKCKEKLPAIKNVTLTSREVNQERLCFLFEVSESKWKPELGIFLCHLPNLTHLTVNDFCDDDTVSMIGKYCYNLLYLRVSLGPESFSEQQLSDEGFSDLIEFQLARPTLREVDIADCFTSAVTAKTILNFAKLQSVTKLHVMWSHFIWMDLSIRFLGKDFVHNYAVKVLTVKFGFDNFENSRYFNADQGAINFVSRVFPSLDELRIFNLCELTTEEEILNLRDTFGDKIKSVSIKKCKNLKVINQMVPNVEKLDIGILMCPDTSGVTFDNLTELSIHKDMFAIEFKFVHDMLAVCTQIKVFKVFSLKVANYDEDLLIQLFSSKKHLTRMEIFSLNFRTSSPMSSRLVHFLVSTCPNLEKIENLLSWNLDGLDFDLLASHGKSVMFARKNHWSLPWKTEDGVLHDVESGHGGGHGGGVGDLFDNR